MERPGTEAAVVPLEEGEFSAPHTASKVNTALRHTLDQWLYRRDLYKGNLPVSGRRFFGREQELSELFKAIDSGTHVGLFGLRKVGKTSLIKQIAEKRTRDIVLYIDLLTTPAAIRDCNYLYWNIANALVSSVSTKYPSVTQSVAFRLGGRYHGYGDIPSALAVSVDFDADIRSIIQALLANSNTSDVKIILLLDEVEKLLPIEQVQAGFSGYIDFFGYLRGIAQQYGVLVSIVTAANPSICEQPTWEGRDNPVFRFYHEMFLAPFTEDECDEMVEKLGRGMGLAFTQRSLADIFQKTGGHPFITRQFCSRLAATFRERPLEVKPLHVAGAVDEFVREDGPTFFEILARLDRYFPSEKQALISIACGRDSDDDLEGLLGRGVTQDLHHLTGYQLVHRDRDRYKLTIGLLGLWIRRYWAGDES